MANYKRSAWRLLVPGNLGKNCGIMRAVDHVIARFPDMGTTVRQLYLRDEEFRTICEDLGLAIDSLRHYQDRPDADLRSEIDDYRKLLHELEEELREYLVDRSPD